MKSLSLRQGLRYLRELIADQAPPETLLSYLSFLIRQADASVTPSPHHGDLLSELKTTRQKLRQSSKDCQELERQAANLRLELQMAGIKVAQLEQKLDKKSHKMGKENKKQNKKGQKNSPEDSERYETKRYLEEKLKHSAEEIDELCALLRKERQENERLRELVVFWQKDASTKDSQLSDEECQREGAETESETDSQDEPVEATPAEKTPNPEDTPEGEPKETPTGAEEAPVTPGESGWSSALSRAKSILALILKGQ